MPSEKTSKSTGALQTENSRLKKEIDLIASYLRSMTEAYGKKVEENSDLRGEIKSLKDKEELLCKLILEAMKR